MGVVWHGGCGHLKFFCPLRAYSCKRTPLLKLLDPPLEKMAFTTPQGLLKFRVMPFGLCNALAGFERLIQQLL